MGSGNGDSRTAVGVLNLQHIQTDALGRAELLGLDLLVLGEHGVNLAQVDIVIMVDIALYHTGNDILLLAVPVLEQGLSLLLADLLKNHVLRVLRCNSSELLRVDGKTHDVADSGLRVPHPRFRFADLKHAVFHRLHDFLLGNHRKVAGLPIHLHADIVRAAVVVPAGGDERILNRIQQHILADIVLSLNGLQRFHQFLAHFPFSSCMRP